MFYTPILPCHPLPTMHLAGLQARLEPILHTLILARLLDRDLRRQTAVLGAGTRGEGEAGATALAEGRLDAGIVGV